MGLNVMTEVECDNKDCKYWIHDDTCTRNKISVQMLYDSDETKKRPYCYNGLTLIWAMSKDKIANLCDSCKFATKSGDWYMCDHDPSSLTKYHDTCDKYEEWRD